MSKYRNIAILDCEKGATWSATEIAQLLRNRGFKAKRGYSPYVNHVAVTLDFDNLNELRGAYRSLKSFGILSEDFNIKDAVTSIRMDLKYKSDYAGHVA